MFRYPASDIQVIDGDTIRCDLDLGFHTWRRGETLRLAGINAPEISTPEGRKSKKTLQVWIDENYKNVTIQTVKTKAGSDQREKYGRYLAIIWIKEMNVNERLVTLGLAQEAHYR